METLSRDLSEAHFLFQMLLLSLHQTVFLSVRRELLLCFAYNNVCHYFNLVIQFRLTFNSGIKKNCINFLVITPILQKVKLRYLKGLPS